MSEFENSNNSQEINPVQLEVFKEKVKEWLSLDDDIKTLNSHLKERKKRKNDLTPEILDFMNQHKIDDMNSDGHKLKYTESKIKKPINKDYIQKQLSNFLKNTQQAEDATDYILTNREITVKVRLKRINKKN